MKLLSISIRHAALPVLALSMLLFSSSASADSIIRITGDRTAISSNNTSGAAKTEPTLLPVRTNTTTMRIIGDRSGSAQVPDSIQAGSSEQNPPVFSIKDLRVISDKIEIVQKKTPEQPVVSKLAEQDVKTKAEAEAKRISLETAELQMTQRLAELKAEEERKAAEKVEQKRLSQVKADREHEIARHAAIERERQQLANRKEESARADRERTEQERLIKEKREQEKAVADAVLQATVKQERERLAVEAAENGRIAALQAEEERLATARRVLTDRAEPEMDSPPRYSGTAEAAENSPVVMNTLDNGINQASDTKTGETTETIWDLYISAKAIDPALGRSEARVSGSKADSDLLFSSLMPHIDSSAGVKLISQSLTNYSANDASYDFTALNYNVTARLTLLHVPTIFSLTAAAAGLNGERAGVAVARQNLIVKFTDAYFALLKAQVDRQIARGEINRLKQVLEQSQAFLKAGTGDVIAVYEAQSRLDGAGADLTRSESTLRLAEQKLATVVGKPVASIENYLPQQPTGPDPANLDWWIATMEKEQPIVRQAREGLIQTSEQRKAVKAEYLPFIQASGGYDVNRGSAALPTAEVRQWFLGASISLPLYSGGETAAKLHRAIATEEERRHAFDETIDQQRENVKQAFYSLRYNISLIKALEQKKISAKIQLAAVSKGRNIGTRNAVDLLNAEQAYSVALRDYKYALYDNFIRVIQLKSAAGILADADVSKIAKAVAPTIVSSFRPPSR